MKVKINKLIEEWNKAINRSVGSRDYELGFKCAAEMAIKDLEQIKEQPK